MLPAILALSALAVNQDVPLVPETPGDWRGERLDFPLSFAPDIDLRGYEEIRFAPGMFDPKAPDYFSYLFGIHIEGEPAVDEAFLSDFLRRYYGGLCRTVGEGRGLDPRRIEVAVEVGRGAGRFLARVDMVDAFVTGEPLALTIEIDVDPGVSATTLFATASPAPEGAPIRARLRRLRDAWRAARPAALLLNHVYLVVDERTYDALIGCEWLRDTFAPGEERTTVRRDMSYTGLYLYGEHTYFEFLPEGVAPQLPEGGTGLALGFEVPGATAKAAAELERAGVKTFRAPVTRRLGEEHVPWFEMMGVEVAHERSRLSVFTLEYDPRFLGAWHPEVDAERESLARRDVLARYVASLGLSPGVLRDVTAVHLRLDAAERERVETVVSTLGWRAAETDTGWRLDGPGADLIVTAQEGPGGIVGLDLSLREPIEREALELGSLRLEFHGDRATLRAR